MSEEKNKYYKEIDEILKIYEGKSLDTLEGVKDIRWAADRIYRYYLWELIPKPQIDELSERVSKIFNYEVYISTP